MTISGIEWARMLTNLSTNKDLWIVKGEDNHQPFYKIMARKDYHSFFKNHSSKNSCLQKLSFKEIIVISKQILSEPRFNQHQTTRFFINPNVFERDSLEEIKMYLTQVQDEHSSHLEIRDILNQMHARSKQKRLAEKTKSLWGRIKYYIWSCFYDKSKQLINISKYINSFNHIRCAKEALQNRILVNMNLFEEEIGVPLDQHTNDESIKTPKDVKHIWLKKYAEDKWSAPVTPEADTYRKRIIAVNKIWEELNKIYPENSSPKNPSVTTKPDDLPSDPASID
jgi:hypothetical protein